MFNWLDRTKEPLNTLPFPTKAVEYRQRLEHGKRLRPIMLAICKRIQQRKWQEYANYLANQKEQ